MSKYKLQKLFFKKSKKLLMTSCFWSRSRSWSRTLPVSVSKPKLRSRPVLVSVLISEKFRGLGLGLGLGRVGLDYSPAKYGLEFHRDEFRFTHLVIAYFFKMQDQAPRSEVKPKPVFFSCTKIFGHYNLPIAF